MALQGLALEFDLIPEVVEAGLPNCTCTIQERTNTVSALGQPDLTDWVDVPGFVDIDAMASVMRSSPLFMNLGATVRKPEELDTSTEIHILLMGYYPGILQQNQAVLTGGPYPGPLQLIGVEHDSQKTMTRLSARVWTL